MILPRFRNPDVRGIQAMVCPDSPDIPTVAAPRADRGGEGGATSGITWPAGGRKGGEMASAATGNAQPRSNG